MKKKLFIACLGFFFLSIQAAAQQQGQKVLVVVRDFNKPFSAGRVLARAIQFKKAGLYVTVFFEGEGIFNLLESAGVTATPAWAQKVKDGEKLRAKQSPDPTSAIDPNGAAYRDLESVISGQPYFKGLVTEMKALTIPYTVCAVSSNLLGVYDYFKAAGEPLSKDPMRTLDLAPYIKGNYYIIFSS